MPVHRDMPIHAYPGQNQRDHPCELTPHLRDKPVRISSIRRDDPSLSSISALL